jgi:hypothetical protein
MFMLRLFSLTPDDRPPRLFRYYQGGEDQPVAVLDKEKNLLFINSTKYERLTPIAKELVLRTQQAITH